MAPIDPVHTRRVLDEIAATANGTLLEDLITALFPPIPGVNLHDRDRLSASGSEELDLAFSSAAHPDGLAFFDRDLLVECKSQGDRVDAHAVNWFATKLRRRRQPLGVLVALAGSDRPQRPLSTRCAGRDRAKRHGGPAGPGRDYRGAGRSTVRRALCQSAQPKAPTTDQRTTDADHERGRALKAESIPGAAGLCAALLHPAANLAGAEADPWPSTQDASSYAATETSFSARSSCAAPR